MTGRNSNNIKTTSSLTPPLPAQTLLSLLTPPCNTLILGLHKSSPSWFFCFLPHNSFLAYFEGSTPLPMTQSLNLAVLSLTGFGSCVSPYLGHETLNSKWISLAYILLPGSRFIYTSAYPHELEASPD